MPRRLPRSQRRGKRSLAQINGEFFELSRSEKHNLLVYVGFRLIVCDCRRMKRGLLAFLAKISFIRGHREENNVFLV